MRLELQWPGAPETEGWAGSSEDNRWMSEWMGAGERRRKEQRGKAALALKNKFANPGKGPPVTHPIV